MKAVIFIAALLVAGCLGYPPGTAGPGDRVQVQVSATDADSGQSLLTTRTVSLTNLGTGASGLGFTVERALMGQAVNASLDVKAVDDAGLRFSSVKSRDAFYVEVQLQERTVPRASFESQYGVPTVGAVVQDARGAPWQVLAVNETQVLTKQYAEDGQREEARDFGVAAVYHVTGSTLRVTLEALPGQVFRLRNDPTTGTNPLDLPPGVYRALDNKGDQVRFEYAPTQFVELVDKNVVFHVKVVSISQGGLVRDETNLAKRISPVVQGDASALIESLKSSAPAHEAPAQQGSDGHDHAH